MVRKTAWVLNLDADLELAAGPTYAPSQALMRLMAPHVARLASTLLAPGDVVVDDTSPAHVAAGLIGRAFCPTRRALALLRRAGAEPEPHPPHEVLRTVNGRAFCASLGPTLPGARFATTLELAESTLATEPPVGAHWRAKRAFGMAGRGQRLIRTGPLTPSDRAFLLASIERDGGIMLEPNVPVVRELCLHGMLDASGGLSLGKIVEQQCDSHGQWQASTVATNVEPNVQGALEAEAHRVATALTAAGYFGPFGIDAFIYRRRDGTTALQTRSEINARYSMGFKPQQLIGITFERGTGIGK